MTRVRYVSAVSGTTLSRSVTDLFQPLLSQGIFVLPLICSNDQGEICERGKWYDPE